MRCAVKQIRVAGRNTQGVRIKNYQIEEEKVVSVIKIEDNINKMRTEIYPNFGSNNIRTMPMLLKSH